MCSFSSSVSAYIVTSVLVHRFTRRLEQASFIVNRCPRTKTEVRKFCPSIVSSCRCRAVCIQYKYYKPLDTKRRFTRDLGQPLTTAGWFWLKPRVSGERTELSEVLKSYRRVNPCDADSTMDLKISGLPVFRGRLAHVSCGHPEPHTNEASALDCVGLELGMSNVCQSGPRK